MPINFASGILVDNWAVVKREDVPQRRIGSTRPELAAANVVFVRKGKQPSQIPRCWRNRVKRGVLRRMGSAIRGDLKRGPILVESGFVVLIFAH